MSWNCNLLFGFLGFLIGIVSTIIYLKVDLSKLTIYSKLKYKLPISIVILIFLYSILNNYKYNPYFLNIFAYSCGIIGAFFVGFYVMAEKWIEGKFIRCLNILLEGGDGDIFGEVRTKSAIIGFLLIVAGLLLEIWLNLIQIILNPLIIQ